jgi:hypothetical protein
MAIAACCVPSSVWAGNLLQNPGFDTPTPGLSPPNYPTSTSATGTAEPSSAEFWSIFNNFPATTSTELLPTTDPLGSGSMIHVTSVGANGGPPFFNGLLQSFAQQSGAVTASVDLFVLSGPVIVALFSADGGTFIGGTLSSTTNQWETISFTAAAGTNPDLIAIYSENLTGTGEFYADHASVQAIPEPASGLLALIGISASAFWVRKTRPRLGRRPAEPST